MYTPFEIKSQNLLGMHIIMLVPRLNITYVHHGFAINFYIITCKVVDHT